MPVIEFNVKAKPPMATPFGGVLMIGHHYKLRNGYLMKIVPDTNKEAPDSSWVLGEFLSSPLKGTKKWWMSNGIFQGMEHIIDYKYHVIEEIAPNEVPEEQLQLKLGTSYITKAGWKTTPMELAVIYNSGVDGPVLFAKLYKPDGGMSLKCYWNTNGLYLGSGSLEKLAWPKGSPDSVRTIVKVALS